MRGKAARFLRNHPDLLFFCFRYSVECELVLDQFAGGGTTLVEAKLLNRNIIGVDINESALIRCRDKTAFIHNGANCAVYLILIPNKTIVSFY